ncbi:hypothetical protein MMC34_005975 [Xylographa carneopallida]|nr:hypothetical protein [Xylographa carneopallida]
MDDEISRLEKIYCPPIDSALFFALISDYDLTQDASVRDVRSTLNALKASADAEEATAFDPSGSSNYAAENSPHGSADRPQSWNGDALSRTEETDLTSLSRSVDSFGLEDGEHNEDFGKQHDAELEALPVADKEALLAEMFPGLKPFDRSYTLKKSRYNFARTVEQLLNQVFLLEEPASDGEPHPIPRGIDAFTHPTPQSRKPKSKHRKQPPAPRRSSSTPAPLADKSPNTPSSKWEQAKADVDFLVQRTYLPPTTIASTYHAQHASLAATIHALCLLPSIPNPYISATDSLLATQAIDLAHAFPAVSPSLLRPLVQLTHPSTTSAHDLARTLTSTPHYNASTAPLTPHYTLPHPSTSPPTSTPTPTTPSTLPLPRAQALALAASHATTHSALLARASTAYQLSKSRPLMSAAAGYYASQSRAAGAASARYAARAADALVDAQASRAEIDLHGVGVKDAVRIAEERVWTWWEGGAREWAREGKVQGDGGFRVVVGVGRHSEGGKGRLGPAVGGALVRAGWRVEVGEGVLVVRGRARR